jgi:uncharacterized protein
MAASIAATDRQVIADGITSRIGWLDDGRAARLRGDYATAVRLFRLAADQGDAIAQQYLGVMYIDGEGVPQNYAEAFKWYRLAADQSIANAQLCLGSMYATGKGVTQDYVRAHMWFNLSAAQGNENAENARDNIAKRMTPAQIAEAQKLAREWQPKRP